MSCLSAPITYSSSISPFSEFLNQLLYVVTATNLPSLCEHLQRRDIPICYWDHWHRPLRAFSQEGIKFQVQRLLPPGWLLKLRGGEREHKQSSRFTIALTDTTPGASKGARRPQHTLMGPGLFGSEGDTWVRTLWPETIQELQDAPGTKRKWPQLTGSQVSVGAAIKC